MTLQERNITIGVIALVVVFLGAYYFLNRPTDSYVPTPTPQEQATTTPSNNSGTNAPTLPSAANTEAALNQSVQALGVTLKPLVVTEDSRCPSNVQCIQAGTVRVRVRVGSDIDTESEKVFTLGTPMSLKAGTVELVSVAPLKNSTQQIKSADYRFIFKIIRDTSTFEQKG